MLQGGRGRGAGVGDFCDNMWQAGRVYSKYLDITKFLILLV